MLELGLEAFEQLSDESREEELVRKFAMGCSDKEAAQYVINSRPTNLEEAITLMRSHQENATLIFGKKESSIY